MINTRVLVGMASIPERAGSLERAIESLAPQADRIVVSLNSYPSVPKFFRRFLNVEVILLRDGNGGDAEKFAAVDDWDGYVATVDDDILYPPDYIATLIAGINRHGLGTIVGFHGGKTLGWTGSAIAASHKQIRCLGELAEDDTDVNVLGTGAMAYHADHVPLWRDAFPSANMADVHLACHARSLGIPMVALAHRAGWLRDICPAGGRSIYESNRRRDGSDCDTSARREQETRRFDWAAAAPARPRVRVSVATCQRPEKLLELLDDLAIEASWADLEVCVYEDPHVSTDYSAARAFCELRGWQWHRFTDRLAKKGHWQLVDRELRDCESSTAEWFLFLPDDVRLVRHAIPRAIAIWGRLEAPSTLTLWRLRSLEGMSNWTGKLPVQHAVATEIHHVDGLYLCRRETLEALGFVCQPQRVRHATGSGVGRWISLKLDRAGKRMYRVDRSLVTCNDDGVSIMNPAERIRNPAVVVS